MASIKLSAARVSKIARKTLQQENLPVSIKDKICSVLFLADFVISKDEITLDADDMFCLTYVTKV